VGPSFSWCGLILDVQTWLGWWLADEALEVGKESGVQDLGAPGSDGFGLAVVEVGGSVQVEPAMAVLIVEQRKNSGQGARAPRSKGTGKAGRYKALEFHASFAQPETVVSVIAEAAAQAAGR
jgi:hypothetical protein